MSEQDVETVRRAVALFREPWSEVFNRGLADPEVRWHPPAEMDSEVYVGREIATFMRSWTDSFYRWSMSLDEVREVNGYVLGILTQEAYGKGSSAPVSMKFAGLYTVRDGAVSEVRFFLDEAEAIRAAETAP